MFGVFYDFPDGLPKVHEHDGLPPQALGIFHAGRLVVFYSYESDLGNGWEDPEVHGNPADDPGAGAPNGGEPRAVRARADCVVSPSARDLGARVDAVRRYLQQRSALAAGTWAVAGLHRRRYGRLALRWAGRMESGKRGPGVAGCGDRALARRRARMPFGASWTSWLDEARLSRTIESAAAMREGEVRVAPWNCRGSCLAGCRRRSRIGRPSGWSRGCVPTETLRWRVTWAAESRSGPDVVGRRCS
jgi:hypothetical protein